MSLEIMKFRVNILFRGRHGRKAADSSLRLALAAVLTLCFLGTPLWGNETCTWTGSWDSTPDEATDDIIIDSGDLTWDDSLPPNVASWLQGPAYTNTVTFDNTDSSVLTNLTIAGDCVISNGTWTHAANGAGAPATRKIDVFVGGNLILATDAMIDVKAKGYFDGPGEAVAGRTGGSHGGQGGENGGARGPTYGSLTAPVDPGSGGAESAHRGGGAVKLTVAGTTTLDGEISADGSDFILLQGCGSGGSVYLTTAMLGGSGWIHANGGIGDPAGSLNVQSGGGGRISVTLTSGTSFGSVGMQAHGGTYQQAGGGTVYRRSASHSLSEGVLIIDNAGASTYETDISSQVTETSVGEVQILNNGRLQILSNQRLDVSRVWSNAGFFNAETDSDVALISTQAATVYGSSSFQGLIVSNLAKWISFEAGATTTVDQELFLTGSGVSNLLLRSTASPTPWFLDVAAASILGIVNVDVQDSNADPGATVSALLSTDSGNNSNWVFATVGMTNVWLGSLSSDWGASLNWSQGRPPIPEDVKIVISNGTFNAILPSAKSVAELIVTPGAILDLGTHNLAVTGNADINGGIIARATETLRFMGEVDFTDGSFNRSTSTVYLADSDAQSMTSGGVAFHVLIVTNAGRSVTFTDLVSTEVLRDESASITLVGGVTGTMMRVCSAEGALTLTFGASTTSTIRDLFLQGQAGQQINLVSSSPATPWNLNLLRRPCVHHVMVADSDASGGETVYPYLSVNGGGNLNWSFGSTTLVWHGSTSADFSAAANWTPAIAPDTSARVIIDGLYLNAPAILTPQSVLELQLGCQHLSTLTLDGPLSIVEDMTVFGSGRLISNDPITIGGSLVVHGGGDLTHDANSDDGVADTNRLMITVSGNLTLDPGAMINVNEKGYFDGPGEALAGRTGGSHGGQGGVNAGGLGPTYGSARTPVDPGSGGSGSSYNGGGAVRLTVAGVTTLHGQVSSDGEDYDGAPSGCGSGGSVTLTTAMLKGLGTISANGGVGDFAGSLDVQSGGGGRIAVTLTGGDSFGSVRMTAFPGAYGRPAAGTVYREKASDGSGKGTLTIANDGEQSQDLYTTIPGQLIFDVSELEDVTLIVTNFAWMQISTSMTAQALMIHSANETFDLGDANDRLIVNHLGVNGGTTTKGGFYTTNNWNGFPTPPNATGAGNIFILSPGGSVLEFR
jgi:hypothetical protein